MLKAYEVRCCCRPKKLLGYFDLDNSVGHGKCIVFPLVEGDHIKRIELSLDYYRDPPSPPYLCLKAPHGISVETLIELGMRMENE